MAVTQMRGDGGLDQSGSKGGQILDIFFESRAYADGLDTEWGKEDFWILHLSDFIVPWFTDKQKARERACLCVVLEWGQVAGWPCWKQGGDTETGGKVKSMSSGLVGNEEASVLPLLFSQ